MQSLGRHTTHAVLKLPRAAAPQADSGQSPSLDHCFASCRGTGKADSLFFVVHLFFFFFSVEIWLCAYGDEEPQLQPGGEEVRAPQNPLKKFCSHSQPLQTSSPTARTACLFPPRGRG